MMSEADPWALHARMHTFVHTGEGKRATKEAGSSIDFRGYQSHSIQGALGFITSGPLPSFQPLSPISHIHPPPHPPQAHWCPSPCFHSCGSASPLRKKKRSVKKHRRDRYFALSASPAASGLSHTLGSGPGLAIPRLEAQEDLSPYRSDSGSRRKRRYR